jgi:Rrf2 family protein
MEDSELREIAKKENISLKYLEQVINPLRAAGLVKSIRGSKGGYSLAKPPSEICLYDVVETLEGPLRLVECLHDSKVCQKFRPADSGIWKEVSDAISKILLLLKTWSIEKEKEKALNVPNITNRLENSRNTNQGLGDIYPWQEEIKKL